METKKTILLTGATGFLGSHLLECFISEGYHVVVIKRSTSDLWRINHLYNQFNSYDIDKEPLERIFIEEQIDCVVHMATLYKKFDQPNEIKSMVDANVSFPSQLLVESVKHGVKGFINTGTFFEYDCKIQPVNENAPIQAFNFYAKTKLAFESILKTYSHQLCIYAFKLFSPFGERDNNKLLPLIIQHGIDRKLLSLSEGLQKIDLIYCKDIADVYLNALQHMTSEHFKPQYEQFNLGMGKPLSLRDIVSMVEEELGTKINVEWGPPSLNDIPIAYADITKVKTLFDWSPKFGVRSGIKNTVEYYLKQNNGDY